MKRVGERIGEFIVEGVKEGGIGIVYFVYFVHRERDEPERFVLKTLKPQFMEYAEMREIFRREAELWIRLSSHPNIVSAYRIIEEGNELYILAERIMPDSNFGCVSAEDWLQRRPFWPLEGINFAIQICRAMHWAQRQIPGFIHRDIKPGNMLIAGDTIKLSDFGFGGTVAEIDFLSGKPVGTIWYMSPEVIRREKATVRSDVYSFGATLYHMFSGRPVFTGSEREIKEAHLNEVPELLEKLCKVPKELSDIVMRCLEKNPENRYANFKEIGMALQEIHKKLTGQYVPKSGPPSVDYQKLKGRFYSLKDLGREKEADELLKWVESVGHSDTLTDLALLFIDQHRHKDAIRVLKKAFLKDNFHRYYRREVPFLYLSVCLFNEERWGELREVTSEALKIKPDDPYLIALEGAASLFLGSPGQAIDRFQEAEKLEPGDAYLFSIIGLAFMKKNNYPQAEQWFRKALEKDDKNLCALFNLALICNDKKDYTEAISLWQRFLDVCPSDDPFRKKAQEYIVELKKIL